MALPYAAGPTTEKRAHEVGLKLDVNAQNVVRGSYSHNRVESMKTPTPMSDLTTVSLNSRRHL